MILEICFGPIVILINFRHNFHEIVVWDKITASKLGENPLTFNITSKVTHRACGPESRHFQ